MRPALTANSGSRGKIQQRCCQGRIASAWSQRQTVLSLMVATNPNCRACCATSATLRRESGKPSVAGSSHASALTCTTTSGGKSPWSARASLIFQARQAVFEKALAPQAHDFASRMQARSNLVVAPTFGGEEDHLGPDDLIIRQRIFHGSPGQLGGLCTRQHDTVRASPWHGAPPCAGTCHKKP